MNAPNSFISGNTQAITSYPAEQRVVPAVVIDIRDKTAHNPDYQLTKQDVLGWEAQNGQIAPGSFVILFTGWEDPLHGVGRQVGPPEGVHPPRRPRQPALPGVRGAHDEVAARRTADLRRRDRHPRGRSGARHVLRDEHADRGGTQDRNRVHGEPGRVATDRQHARTRTAPAARWFRVPAERDGVRTVASTAAARLRRRRLEESSGSSTRRSRSGTAGSIHWSHTN